MSKAAMTEIVLEVQDVGRSLDFYENILTLPIGDASENYAQCNGGTATITLLRDRSTSAEGGARAYERTANLTFLVSDLPGRCAELERVGVTFTERHNYEVGQIADFADVDGHWLSLYEPSQLAMTWPGADKLRDAAATSHRSPLIYVFIFVGDADVAAGFYGGTLGLPVVDSRACRRGSTLHEKGVVKYDASGVLLTTHHAHGCPASVRTTHTGAAAMTPVGPSGVTPVLTMPTATELVASSTRTEDGFDLSVIPGALTIKTVSDPFGHRLLLRQLETASSRVHD